MSLTTNIASLFSTTFGNLAPPGTALIDISDSLASAINSHVSSPSANRAFVPEGFGSSWIMAYTHTDLPTSVLANVANYLDPLIRPILADAVAAQIRNAAVLMAAAAPPVGIAAVVPVSAVLGGATGLAAAGGPAILTTLTTGVATANSTGATSTIPALVSTALLGLSGLVVADRMSLITYASIASLLDFLLQNVGLAGITNQRQVAWSSVNTQLLGIPVPTAIYGGESGSNMWRAMMLTILQGVPGMRAS